MLPEQSRSVRRAWKQIKSINELPAFVQQFITAANLKCLKIEQSNKTYESRWCLPYLRVEDCRFTRDNTVGGASVRFYPTRSNKIYVVPKPDGYICMGGPRLERRIEKAAIKYVAWHNFSEDIAWSNYTILSPMKAPINISIESRLRELSEQVETLCAVVASLQPKLPPLPPIPSQKITPPPPPSRENSEED